PSENYKCECGNNHALGEILTKKPIIPSQQEIAQNRRSRSAKLRIFAIK
ncbi:16S rRNA (cytosine(1402)-N(4))-methyltransferase, partial [Helicobacter typhlonius]